MSAFDIELHFIPSEGAYRAHLADDFAHAFRSVHAGPLTTFSINEKFRVAAVECLGKVGRESAGDDAGRCPAVSVRMS